MRDMQPLTVARWRLVLAAAALVAVPDAARSQMLDEENSHTVTLGDGTQVVVLAQASPLGSKTKSNRFYYLPTNLRLSRRPDGDPEFLLLKYTTEARATAGGIQGGLLHFLMEWGLSAEQQRELQQELARRVPGAVVAGAASVAAAGDGSFRIVSATLANQARTRALVTSGKAPVLPGSRVAVAADLDQYGAQLLDASLARATSISDVSIEVLLSYRTLVPAANGRIRLDWSRLEHSYDSLVAEYAHRYTGDQVTWDCILEIFCAKNTRPQYSYSYDEMRRQFSYLEENRIVTLEFDERVADERVEKIREAFFQYFLNAFAERADAMVPLAPGDTVGLPDMRSGGRYTFRRTTQSRVQEFNLTFRLAFDRPLAVVGNFASWYDGVRHNPRAVASVNLNDPFYQHYDVRFRVDFDAPQQLFSEAINYVTVTLRKDRPAGYPFEQSVTIDERYVKEHGLLATLSYARGDDPAPADYRYRVQWSLRGGRLFPPSPAWQQGNALEAVTLVPPVVPRKIEVEGDLAELQASDITRVTVQLHYPQFGREVEENIQLPVAGGEPLVSKVIFMDRDARGYAYRLVVNHKREGKLALPWSPRVGDDYIYAAIPENLVSAPDILAAAQEAARDVARSASERVLERFEDVLGGRKP